MNKFFIMYLINSLVYEYIGAKPSVYKSSISLSLVKGSIKIDFSFSAVFHKNGKSNHSSVNNKLVRGER